MKDPAHHNGKTQRKVLRKARQEEEREERKTHHREVEAFDNEQMPVEVEEQPLVIRPSQRDVH